MLQFEGDKDFRLTPDVVWARLTDPAFLIRCIPDVDRVVRAEGDEATFVIRPGLAFVRGTLEVNGRLRDKVAPRAVSYDLHSKGIGASSSVTVALTLAAAEGGTRVHWTAEVKELGGLLKLVPAGLVRGAAQKVISELWDAIERRMRAEA